MRETLKSILNSVTDERDEKRPLYSLIRFFSRWKFPLVIHFIELVG